MIKIHFYFLQLSFFFALMSASLLVFSEPACMKNIQNEEDINICQHTEAKQLELELNDLEHSIRSRFKSPQIERFDEAQTRWQQMTEKDCEIESTFYEGAVIYPAIQSECLQRHYRDRMETLKKYICPEPNLGSGCDAVEKVSAPAVVELPPTQTRSKPAITPKNTKPTNRFR